MSKIIDPSRLKLAFDDENLIPNAGLFIPVLLALRLGFAPLCARIVDLGPAVGRANVADKLLTLIASALIGGDCIDDADLLRAGATRTILGFTVKAPSTLGTFLRSFTWGHVRQLDRLGRELLKRAWSVGAGPGDGLLRIDLDSTHCETYGRRKQGAGKLNYSGRSGYHPLLATLAGSGEVLFSRLREGEAHTGRAAAHFLTETIGRVRYAGAEGPLTLRA